MARTLGGHGPCARRETRRRSPLFCRERAGSGQDVPGLRAAFRLAQESGPGSPACRQPSDRPEGKRPFCTQFEKGSPPRGAVHGRPDTTRGLHAAGDVPQTGGGLGEQDGHWRDTFAGKKCEAQR